MGEKMIAIAKTDIYGHDIGLNDTNRCVYKSGERYEILQYSKTSPAMVVIEKENVAWLVNKDLFILSLPAGDTSRQALVSKLVDAFSPNELIELMKALNNGVNLVDEIIANLVARRHKVLDLYISEVDG